MEKIFIDQNLNISNGKKAENLIKNQNDFIYYNSKEKGVHKVDTDRWEMAQNYERITWMEHNLSANDDRNITHLERFDNLKSLYDYNEKIKNVIELGCGPFTNIRLLTNFNYIENITLVDPLINDYLNHPNCSYKDKKLLGKDVELISLPIEKIDTQKKFDLVIIINVLEHCFDVENIFKKIYNLLSEDGILVFSDVFFKDVKSIIENIYDAGHPIRLSEEKLLEFTQKFNSLYLKFFHNLYGQKWRNDIYFIGKKQYEIF
jgi:SAM-dependent methyltransferase